MTAIGLLPSLRDVHEKLLRKGSDDVGHLRPSDHGFEATRRLDGKSVLLIDDTFTSGARAQSAASSLASAGANVVAIVAIGRVIDPGLQRDGA
ncbi:MAG: hypothetical protein ACRDQ6_22135 [Pseudonocardiaceae bacterium]